jgi:hypothetical protein
MPCLCEEDIIGEFTSSFKFLLINVNFSAQLKLLYMFNLRELCNKVIKVDGGVF